MSGNRTSGILLHLTSLPGAAGVGKMGPEAYRFVDFLVRTGQGIWQVLPIGPPGHGNSPYQCYSAFAGNPLLISPAELVAQRLLDEGDLPSDSDFSPNRVDFERAIEIQNTLLTQAFRNFYAQGTLDARAAVAAFSQQQAAWLDDYALFQALKKAHGGSGWTSWDAAARDRDPQALARWRETLATEIAYEKFVQYEFYRQWRALKAYANERNVAIVGDLPIFVAHDSADVWAHQDLFALEPNGRPTIVAGVPPDYFSETGQLWGNPLYRWERMAATGYRWWVDRLGGALELFDQIRLDHFRGFEAYWEVPGTAQTAAAGQWVPGPGSALFEKLQQELGILPIIAEDLGVITPEVEALRDQFAFPGMRVLQFAFGEDPKGIDYQPHNYIRNCVVYTGTHDNDTAVGWFSSEAGEGTTRGQKEIDVERALTLRYTGTDGHEIHWDLIRLALASVADTAVFPLQDLLGLGTEARMNMPGTATGNWGWRFPWDMLTSEAEQRLLELTATFGRSPLPIAEMKKH